jgi:hypothetical protein
VYNIFNGARKRDFGRVETSCNRGTMKPIEQRREKCAVYEHAYPIQVHAKKTGVCTLRMATESMVKSTVGKSKKQMKWYVVQLVSSFSEIRINAHLSSMQACPDARVKKNIARSTKSASIKIAFDISNNRGNKR